MKDKTTDELIEIVVEDIGLPLPKYDYNYRKYIAVFPKNIPTGKGVTGIEMDDIYDTFRDACLDIIEFNNKN